MARAAEDDVWLGRGFRRKHLACLDQFKFEIDRAFGRVKKGWQALGLGLKPISGPSGYKGFFSLSPLRPASFLYSRGQ
jgi:hypothetical protein